MLTVAVLCPVYRVLGGLRYCIPPIAAGQSTARHKSIDRGTSPMLVITSVHGLETHEPDLFFTFSPRPGPPGPMPVFTFVPPGDSRRLRGD